MREVIRQYSPSNIHEIQDLLNKGCEVKHMITTGSEHRNIVVILLVPPSAEL